MIVFELAKSSNDPNVGGVLGIAAWDLDPIKKGNNIFFLLNGQHQSAIISTLKADELQLFVDWLAERGAQELVSFNATNKIDFLGRVMARFEIEWPSFTVIDINEKYPDLPKGDLNRALSYVGIDTRTLPPGPESDVTLFGEIFIRLRDKKIGFIQFNRFPLPSHLVKK
jgi:hypothetical protein